MANSKPASWFPDDIPAGSITLEEGMDHQPVACECCGRSTRRINGYLSRAGHAVAVYLATWTEGHVAERGADLLISVGGWGDGPSYPRRRISLLVRLHDGCPQFMVRDPTDREWADERTASEPHFLGILTSREDALSHPDMPEMFRLAEHVVIDDRRLHAALCAAVDEA